LEIRSGYYFFPTLSKGELPTHSVCKGSESRRGLPETGDATEIRAPRESLQTVCRPAGLGRETGDAKGLGIAQARIKCSSKSKTQQHKHSGSINIDMKIEYTIEKKTVII
jgi:hypothetical protein